LFDGAFEVSDIACLDSLTGLACVFEHLETDALEEFFEFFLDDHSVEMARKKDFLVTEGI